MPADKKSFSWMRLLKRLIAFSFLSTVFAVLTIFLIHRHVHQYSSERIYKNTKDVPARFVAVVLGAGVSESGSMSYYLKNRLDASMKLYNSGKVKRFLLSGDHGRKNYDEVNAMKDYLTKNGVPVSHIFLDHAGFDTYNSMHRANSIFQIEEAIIVTQTFHLPRAIYLARKKNINAIGYAANYQSAFTRYLKIREYLACVKAFLEITLDVDPRFEGPAIPITGDSRPSHD